MKSIKLLSLNVEKNYHTELVDAFISAHQPDIWCAQEMCEHEFQNYCSTYGYQGAFAPTCIVPPEYGRGVQCVQGNAILSRFPIGAHETFIFRKADAELPTLNLTAKGSHITTSHWLALLATIDIAGTAYHIGNVHFTWSRYSLSNAAQRHDMKLLIEKLQTFPDMLVAGDFNAARGRKTFALMADAFTDHIPLKYTSSIDPQFHKSGKALPYMVDGLFSTPQYSVNHVRLVNGLSDHLAVVAEVIKI